MGIAKITIEEESGNTRIISKKIWSISNEGFTVTFVGEKIQDYLVFVVKGDKLIIDLENDTQEEKVFKEDLLLETVSISNINICEHCGHIHKGITTKYIRPETMII